MESDQVAAVVAENLALIEAAHQRIGDESDGSPAIDRVTRLLDAIIKARKAIRLLAIETSVVPASAALDRERRNAAQTILVGEWTELERLFMDHGCTILADEELEYGEKMEIAETGILTWWSHLDWVDAKFDAPALVVAVPDPPQELCDIVDEMRECLAYQRYRAVSALCRMALESAVIDVYRRFGLADPYSESYRLVERYVEDHYPNRSDAWLNKYFPSLNDMIGILAETKECASLVDELDEVRITTNKAVHLGNPPKMREGASLAKRTVLAIHRLYEAVEA